MPAKVLIAGSDPSLRLLVRALLEQQGYLAEEVEEGRSVIELLRTEPPDLLILDSQLGEMQGIELCRSLKEDVSLSSIPVVLLAAEEDVDAAVESFEAGADDHIAKPLEPRVFLARIRSRMRALDRERERNPTTLLPGPGKLRRHLRIAFARGTGVLAYADIDSLKAVVDTFGFGMGGRVVRLAGRTILDQVREHGHRGDVVCHIGGDDFVILFLEGGMRICQEICSTFARRVQDLLPEEVVKAGHFESYDRAGNLCGYPLPSVSIVLLDLAEWSFCSFEALEEVAARAKRLGKANPGRALLLTPGDLPS